MSTQKNKEKGNYGEDLAAKFLSNKGYGIIERNWQFIHNEIDIIALDGKTTVFVEVKLRYTDEFGNPEEAVSTKKMREIKRAAEEYIYVKDLEHYRFDIVAITLWPNQQPEIVHFDDAFF
jgi:putative endonuclease